MYWLAPGQRSTETRQSLSIPDVAAADGRDYPDSAQTHRPPNASPCSSHDAHTHARVSVSLQANNIQTRAHSHLPHHPRANPPPPTPSPCPPSPSSSCAPSPSRPLLPRPPSFFSTLTSLTTALRTARTKAYRSREVLSWATSGAESEGGRREAGTGEETARRRGGQDWLERRARCEGRGRRTRVGRLRGVEVEGEGARVRSRVDVLELELDDVACGCPRLSHQSLWRKSGTRRKWGRTRTAADLEAQLVLEEGKLGTVA